MRFDARGAVVGDRFKATLRVAAAVIAVTALTSPGSANAHSCIKHVAEHFDVELVGIYRGPVAIQGPEAVRTLDELINSEHMGQWLLFWRKKDLEFAKFYNLTKKVPPHPGVEAFLEETRQRWMRTGCGTRVPYVPIIPGDYVFEEEHSDGAKKSVGIDNPRLTVSADRRQVELSYTWRGEQQRAVYAVKRANFGGF